MSNLSPTQEGVLVKLAVNYELWRSRGEPKSGRYTKPIGASERTLQSLERRGLVKCDYSVHGYCMAQITPDGLSLAKEAVRS